MHRLGNGVQGSVLAAADFHLLAAEAGDQLACEHLSECRAKLEELALSGSQMASLFVCRIYSRGLGVEGSQPLTQAWISWAKKNCHLLADRETWARVTSPVTPRRYDVFTGKSTDRFVRQTIPTRHQQS